MTPRIGDIRTRPVLQRTWQSKTAMRHFMTSIKEIENVLAGTFDLPQCTAMDSENMIKRVKHLLLVLAGKPL